MKKSGKNHEILVHGDMLIGEVLSQFPDSAQIMQDFGLNCVGCSVNVFEPLKLGAMSHGIEEEIVDDMIERINELALARRKAPADGLYMTEFAATKVKEFAKAEKKEGWGLKITAKTGACTSKCKFKTADKKSDHNPEHNKEPAYAMDFQKKAGAGDKTFEFHGVPVYIDKSSLKNLAGAEVDFIESPYGSGFKITNPRFSAEANCACGNGDTCACN